MSQTRPPAVANAFYAGDPAILLQDVQGYLNAVKGVDNNAPKAIIVPHAGYIYSATVAASAFATLAPLKGKIDRVVLLGPCHRVPVTSMALCSVDRYRTPLGLIPIDHSLDENVLKLAGVEVFDMAHGPEHSLEVQLPFLQVVLGDFQMLPIVVGPAPPTQVANVLEAIWGGSKTLIVISSDLSHDLNYADAQMMDQMTCTAIEALDGSGIANAQACGRHSVKGLLKIAQQRGLRVKTLDLRNSGDTAGTKDRVVGYGAWAFWEPRI